MSFQFRTLDDGRICCSSYNDAGERVAPLHPCDKCKAHFASQGLRLGEHTNDTGAPDGYAEALRAAAAPLPTFEADYKAARLRDVEVTRAALDAEEATPRLTAAELAAWRAPDSYAEPLQKMRVVK